MDMPPDTAILTLVQALAVLPLAALAVLGTNLIVLWAASQLVRPRPWLQARISIEDDQLPRVLVQLPLFNESAVVGRLTRAVAALDWPRDRLKVQLLDDSTDGTQDISAAIAERLQRDGLDIVCIHRADRHHFKAGALGNGLAQDDSPFVAIFDADFVPQPDFLRHALAPLLADDRLAFAQARWEHLNPGESPLTAAQAMLIDAHFAIEQQLRSNTELLLPFNGTCGVWRRQAIDEAGGWSGDTLCEDLDLAIRARLKGWSGVFLPNLAVPGELPATIAGWRAQQFRWTKGFAQVARKLLGQVWRSKLPLAAKLAMTMQTGQTACYPLAGLSALGSLALLATNHGDTALLSRAGGIVAILGIGGSMLCTATGGIVLKRRNLARFPFIFITALLLNAGLIISNSRAVWEAIVGTRSAFVRTPKRGSFGPIPDADRSGPSGVAELGLAACLAAGFAFEVGWLSPLFSSSIIGLIVVGAGLARERQIAISRRNAAWQASSQRMSRAAD
jgi:cellulose synthase/poly-beta-1,6-N-acetylglucosamine synthase-like glycosyltransferase